MSNWISITLLLSTQDHKQDPAIHNPCHSREYNRTNLNRTKSARNNMNILKPIKSWSFPLDHRLFDSPHTIECLPIFSSRKLIFSIIKKIKTYNISWFYAFYINSNRSMLWYTYSKKIISMRDTPSKMILEYWNALSILPRKRQCDILTIGKFHKKISSSNTRYWTSSRYKILLVFFSDF